MTRCPGPTIASSFSRDVVRGPERQPDRRRIGQGVTRNAVIGKVHRLDLSGRAPRSAPPQPQAARKTMSRTLPARNSGIRSMPAPATRAQAAVPAAAQAEADARGPEPEPIRLVEVPRAAALQHPASLSDKTCKWPIGDPTQRGFLLLRHSPREKVALLRISRPDRLSAAAGPAPPCARLDRCRRWFRHRQLDGEGAPAADLGGDCQAPAMPVEDVLDDRQPQARSRPATGSPGRSPGRTAR